MKGSTRANEILNLLRQYDYPEYRSKQIINNIYSRKIQSYQQMKNIPSSLRVLLQNEFGNDFMRLRSEKITNEGNILSSQFKTHDGASLIASLSKKTKSKVLQISSQAGCAFSCKFCPTASMGFKRQLTVDEIVDQVLHFHKLGETIDHLYFSGIGEPLANPNLFDALDILKNNSNFKVSSRKIRISTIGILPGIKKLNIIHPQINLEFSLLTPFSEERNLIVPINRMYPASEVFELLDERLEIAKRHICLNYLLIAGQNDSKDHAKALIDLIRSRKPDTRHLYYVRIIPLIEDQNKSFSSKPSKLSEDFFQAILSKNSIRCAKPDILSKFISLI